MPWEFASRLSESFPLIEMKPGERRDGEKTYRFRTARLGDGGVGPPDGTWAEFVSALRSTEYRDAVSQLSDIALDDAEIEISAWEYLPGDWLSPHVDKEQKLVTQIFYLTRDWHDGDGGRLVILDRDARSVARFLSPTLGSSAVVVRSSESWHAVEESASVSQPRRSVTAIFTKPNGGG
jgi:Rps23 Pro-64 3,4-dihydroxylase Tpa1-like proline 4-hydroxylase